MQPEHSHAASCNSGKGTTLQGSKQTAGYAALRTVKDNHHRTKWGQGVYLHLITAFISPGPAEALLCHFMHLTGLIHRAVRLQMLLVKQTST